MVKNAPIAPNPQEHREDAPPAWPEVQDGLAASSGLALLLVDGYQPPAIVVSNNNSICRTFQSSPEHVKLCDPYCGAAHAEATKANGTIEYKCHAGLQCFAKRVELGNKRNLAVIGGRAFTRSADYRQLIERFRNGDLQNLASEETFSNVIFAETYRVEELSEEVDRKTLRFHAASSNGSSNTKMKRRPEAVAPPAEPAPEKEIRSARSEPEFGWRIANPLLHFLERISCAEPAETYNSIVSNTNQLFRCQRVSLFVFKQDSHELVLKAASGWPADPAKAEAIRTGEGIAGQVIDSGVPMLVTDLRREGIAPAPRDRGYKTNSFISCPIIIGDRKIGVLNVTDKTDGSTFEEGDLGLLEIIGPQMALALEGAELRERATEFERRSITDSLTLLPNRRHLQERLKEELNRSQRYGYPLSFLMIDIDDFKNYNDKNGHPAGDRALEITAHCLRGALRAEDFAARYGGEEFCILLPQTGPAEAGRIVERIRHLFSRTHFPYGKSQPLGRVTVSIGVSTFSSTVNTPENIIAAADRALYQAKNMGKDRVVFYRDENSSTGEEHE